MSVALREGDVILVPEIGETVVDQVFGTDIAGNYSKNHPLSSRCDRIIARDAGDNLIVLVVGQYQYWDHERDALYLLGDEPGDFVVGHEE